MSLESLKPTAEQMEMLIEAVNGLANGQSEAALDSTFLSILDGTNTTKVFRQWWPLSETETNNRYDRLCRFARMLAQVSAGKKYTLRYYSDTVSGSAEMTPQDDLADKEAAQLCTQNTTPVADWADEDPMTWYVRANALSLADGTMNVLAVEGVDSAFDITGETAPVYTFCLALWKKEWSDGDYEYKSWATARHDGYRPYDGDVAPDGQKRDLTWRPTFPGSLNSDGGLTSGSGGKPYLWAGATTGITAARKVTAYEGLWNDADTIWALDMWQLRHFYLENSEVCNGCQSYNYQLRPALAETGVKRVLVTPAQAANLKVGSNMELGEQSGTENPSNDRYYAYNYSICRYANITKIEEVEIDGVTYGAVYLDVETAFDTTATCLFSTMPWDSGVTEKLPGHKDGALYSLTAGISPMRIQGVEIMDGAYTIGLDPLYNVTNFDNGRGDYEVFECKDSENLAGSITSDYVSTGITYEQMPQGWQYVRKFVKTVKAVLFPEKIGGGSTTYFKSAFSGTTSAGVRCPWRFGYLNSGALAGLGCGNGYNAPSDAYWSGRPRLSGSGKKRGEWAA